VIKLFNLKQFWFDEINAIAALSELKKEKKKLFLVIYFAYL
jgi:hypothetical protein